MSLEVEVADCLREVVRKSGRPVREVGRDDPFFEAGVLDSMSLLDFVVSLEGRFGVKIPGEDIVPENFGSLAAVSAYIGRRV